jgi:hypothetical protein
VTARHDQLVRVLLKIAGEAGCATRVEPQFTVDDPTEDFAGGLRPDGIIHFPAATVYIDVSVLHPTAAAHATVASKGQLKCAVIREQAKVNKYSRLAAADHASIVPAVMETYGGIGSRFGKLLRRLAKAAADYNGMEYGAFLKRAYTLLSVCLQKGNARVSSEGSLLARTGTWRRI